MLPKHPRYQTALRPEFGKGVNINYCDALGNIIILSNLEVVLFEAATRIDFFAALWMEKEMLLETEVAAQLWPIVCSLV